MRKNIDSLQGLVFAEAASIYLAGAIGRPNAHSLLEQLTQQALASGRNLGEVLRDAVQDDPQLRAKLDLAQLQALFDPVAATAPAQRLAERQLQGLGNAVSALDATQPFETKTNK
jgi:3-carboxy-cis,cis-muconate cycloisomerase